MNTLGLYYGLVLNTLFHLSPVEVSAKLIWRDEFTTLDLCNKWQAERTSSYEYQNHNPKYNKLDWIRKSNVQVQNGRAVFTANLSDQNLENGKRAWYTGFLTTEYTPKPFMVKTNDYIETRIQLPSGIGCWPALWTWKDGRNEIDSFEYHPNNQNILELSNHVRAGYCFYRNSSIISPGKWVTIGTHYGNTSVSWYVNGDRAFADRRGVGTSWSAYVILNLSMSQSPAPTSTNSIVFLADYVRVYDMVPNHVRSNTDYCRTNGNDWK